MPSRFATSLAIMLGRAPGRPVHKSDAAKALEAQKRSPQGRDHRRQIIRDETSGQNGSHFWRNWRWFSIVCINLLFVLSFKSDIPVVEGALTASRFVGFHMADIHAGLQVILAYKVVAADLAIGMVTVLMAWWLVGGRTFCAWACPYHLLSEWAESLHLWLAGRKIIKDHPLHRGTRTVLFVVFALLAIVTGYTVFETISPVGILSRALTYGGGLVLVWVGVLLAIEVFYSRRFWCRYICPIGLTYGAVGSVSPIGIRFDAEKCIHEGECRRVCLVPHVLEITKMGYAEDVRLSIGADCTRCGMCVDACPTRALSFAVRGPAANGGPDTR